MTAATTATARARPTGAAIARRCFPTFLGLGSALGLALSTTGALAGQADYLIPNQMHTSLTFELHSVGDDVDVYEGDPQFLFRVDVRPEHSIPPKIEFSNTNQAAVLRVLDLWLLEDTQNEPPDDWEEFGEKERRKPQSQRWEIQVAPASPTEFILQCDGGRGTFDFTDLPVRTVHLLADTTRVQIDFKRVNPIALERFMLTVREGEVTLHEFLNARAQSTTLQLEGSKVRMDLIGKPTPGETELFVEGVPREMRIAVSKKIGVHIEGPSATVARFDARGFERRGLALESGDFAERGTRLRLYFSRAIPKLKVEWED